MLGGGGAGKLLDDMLGGGGAGKLLDDMLGGGDACMASFERIPGYIAHRIKVKVKLR